MINYKPNLKRAMNREYFGYLGVEWTILLVTVIWFSAPVAILLWAVFANPSIDQIQSVTLLVLAIVVLLNTFEGEP